MSKGTLELSSSNMGTESVQPMGRVVSRKAPKGVWRDFCELEEESSCAMSSFERHCVLARGGYKGS
jgi:hypothetical protein